MALPFQIYFQGNRDYGLDWILFDLILTEQHNMDANVTQHPVEDGSVISDHIQNQLENGSLSALITNYSLSRFGILTNKAQDVFDSLVELWEEKTVIAIYTVMKVYEDVAITSMPIARDSDTGEAIVIQVTFSKVEQVTLQEISLGLAISLDNLNGALNKQVSGGFNAGSTVGF
jgi:hypothetical protein